ncbi:head GIN domain-containing protein [Qipengyuania qiaonensis]|uniref:DUF2807 domain-containing protein n=1 Tax=Qipengyuania qiaonensis TaxID=2867240 RepID=A0ABS7J4J5_9SPHN|nr:head GIN domain-containing protein [Qipengyuania qiaonensis]MBX7482261.1 DUF2807 domain-containing protein [Qipengyuania qiaonensis]
MFRILAAASLGLAVVTAIPPTPVLAEKAWRSKLDDGQPIGENWSATGDFEQVTLAGSDSVTVTRGDRWQIRASGSAAVLADLRYLVEDGELIIGRRWRREPVRGNARIEVVAPSIDGGTLAGSGNLSVDAMSGSEIDATVAGSGMFDVARVETPRLSATIAGSGSLRVAGRADDTRISIAGSGDLDGTRLRAGRATVTIAGSGDARFNAEDSVSASIVGSGDAIVSGTTNCTQSRMGSGRLTCSR